MLVKLTLLHLKTVDQYKKAFANFSKKKLKINEFIVKIDSHDFEHACYEYLEGAVYKGKFSYKRARRIPIIEQIVKGEIPFKIVLQTFRKKRTVALVSEIAECCVILLPVVKDDERFFRFVTLIAFGRGTEKGAKRIYNTGHIITKRKLSSIFPKEMES